MQERVQQYVSKPTQVHLESITFGTVSNESFLDEAMNSPSVIKIARAAEQNGYDGVFIECMLDLGLEAVREVVDIPVVGPGRTAFLCAADLADNFSIITELEHTNVSFLHLLRKLGLESKLASIRSIEMPVLELTNRDKLLKAAMEAARKAITEDGAHCLVLGCTRMVGVESEMRKRLADEGYSIPLIYGVPLALHYLETLAALGLAQSKRTYRTPPEKKNTLLGRI
jgi:allantoin racemase